MTAMDAKSITNVFRERRDLQNAQVLVTKEVGGFTVVQIPKSAAMAPNSTTRSTATSVADGHGERDVDLAQDEAQVQGPADRPGGTRGDEGQLGVQHQG